MLIEHLNFRGRWMVLIDAAKGCTTEPPNLTMCPADFVVCSFYKVIHVQLFCLGGPVKEM
jgi:selenocysteine lyase/cysteine desulfurase